MKIERIELRHIKMKLVAPFKTSFGIEEFIEHIIVRIDSEGVTGWGECVPFTTPSYTYETTKTVWHILHDFVIPNIIKKDIKNTETLLNILSGIRGNQMAKAGIEAAFCDLSAKRLGKSLSAMLGSTRSQVDVGVSVGIQKSETELNKIVHNYLNEGYKRVKLKIMPGHDVEMIDSFRKEFPGVMLQVDANSAYTQNDFDLFRQLDNYNLLFIEQPFGHDDFHEHSLLQRQIKTQLCLDESIQSFADAVTAIELGSCKSINIKPGRVGGFTEAVKIHDYCNSKNIPVWHGGMLETGIGRAGNLALASLPNFSFPADISAGDRYFDEDIVEPKFIVNSNGTMYVPTKPGIGVDVLTGKLEEVTLRKIEFK